MMKTLFPFRFSFFLVIFARGFFYIGAGSSFFLRACSGDAVDFSSTVLFFFFFFFRFVEPFLTPFSLLSMQNAFVFAISFFVYLLN